MFDITYPATMMAGDGVALPPADYIFRFYMEIANADKLNLIAEYSAFFAQAKRQVNCE